MMLVETLRLRWWMIWWGAIVVVLGLVIGISASHTGIDVNGTRVNGFSAPLEALAPIAMFLAMIFGTSAGLSLNREAETLVLSWTKPVPRATIALRIMLVDVIAVLAMYAIAWLVILGVVAAAGATVYPGPAFAATLVLSIGVAVMWYALVEAITAGLPTNSRGVVGFLWPGALFLSAVNGLGGTVGAIVHVLNVVNPLAYLNGVTVRAGSDVAVNSFWQSPPGERALFAWLLSAALAAAAVALWTRRES